MKIQDVARVCHEANRAYCESLGDHSQVPWEQAPDWQKESCIEGVTLQFEHPGTTPQEHHASWCQSKWDDGWKYGPEKDAEQKTHPCLVEYSKLPMEQQAKDYLFAAIVRALSPMLQQEKGPAV